MTTEEKPRERQDREMRDREQRYEQAIKTKRAVIQNLTFKRDGIQRMLDKAKEELNFLLDHPAND